VALRWSRAVTRRRDPVRREAGRWLVRLKAEAGSDLGAWRVAADLERLRFGPSATWPDPRATFVAARRAVRSARRLARVTPKA
jgi:hypothetical protein